MAGKFLLTLLLLLNYFSGLNAQTLYHFEYCINEKSDTTKYDAFVVLFDAGESFARIKYWSPQAGKENIVQVELEEIYKIGANGEPDENKLGYKGVNPRLISGTTAETFVPAVFWFQTNAEEVLEVWGVSAAENAEEAMPQSYINATLVMQKDLKKSFVLQYYDRSDSVYKKMFEGVARGGTTANSNIVMHVIIVANTNDKKIGASCAMDMKDMQQRFDSMAYYMRIKTNPVTISGNSYNKKNVEAALTKLKPAKQDIVVFYYSGHGFRKEPAVLGSDRSENSIYPFLDLRANPKQDYMIESMGIDTIFKWIKSKGARFNLVLGDCCNAEVEDTNVEAKPIGKKRGSALRVNQQNLNALFLNPQPMSILATAADVQQLASSNNKFGGFFSYFFKAALEFRLSMFSPNPSWEQVLQDAKVETAKKARRTYCDSPYIPENICKQSPIYTLAK